MGMAAVVKVCGCRPHDGDAARTWAGVRKPPKEETAEVEEGGASEAMGFWSLSLCCRGRLSPCLASNRGDDEPGQPIAIGGTGVAQRRSNDMTAIEGNARASLVNAGREPAKQTGSLIILPRTDLGHDVSILITAVEVVGR